MVVVATLSSGIDCNKQVLERANCSSVPLCLHFSSSASEH